jgi:hypothetical protein
VHPGGSDDSDSSSGPVTLKLQANAVKGGKNATEASWLQDWVIPNFQQLTDQGRQVTVQYVGTGVDDEGPGAIAGKVALLESLGSAFLVLVEGDGVRAHVTVPEGRQPAVGDQAFLVPDAERLLVYRKDDGELVGGPGPAPLSR